MDKYSADNWSIQEELDANLSCVDTTVEESGNILEIGIRNS